VTSRRGDLRRDKIKNGRMKMKTSVMKAAALFAAMIMTAGLARAQEVSAELIAKAKQEGKVVYYTDLIVDQIVRPLVAGFEAKYGVKVEYARADSQANLLKLMGEHKAGSMQADVFATTSGLKPLLEVNAVMKTQLEGAKALPPEFKDPNGYWVAANYYVMTPAVNTDLVPEKDRPKTYDDLLDRKWTDKIVWKQNDTSGGPGFIGHVLSVMGEEKGMAYLRKLAGQNITGLKISARAVVDQVIAGEYPLALQILNDNVVISRNVGAPVAWIPMNPAFASVSIISVTAKARHPNAGRLLASFVVSEEGQKIAAARDYIPVHPDVAPRDPTLRPDGVKFRAVNFSPEEVDASMPKWKKVYDELFR
jgi:iron(III) transport system substrate-binding protein